MFKQAVEYASTIEKITKEKTVSCNTYLQYMVQVVITHTHSLYVIVVNTGTSACVTTNMLHFRYSKICPNLTSIFPSAYIVTDSDYDCGS